MSSQTCLGREIMFLQGGRDTLAPTYWSHRISSSKEEIISHILCCLSFFSKEEEEMSNDLTEWQEKADKIFGLLKGDASTRQQAISLLDSLADLIHSAGASGVFMSMFMRPDTVECTFAWMQDALDDMSWSERRDFNRENLFWPLYNVMHRIFPNMAQELHPTFGFKPGGHLPDFLLSPNSVKDIVVLGYENKHDTYSKLLTNAHRLDGVQSISFSDISMFENCFGNCDVSELGGGSGSFHIVESMDNALCYDEVEGKRQLRVATGLFYQEYDFSLQEHPYLQVADIFQHSVENIAELWGLTTPHSVLDLGIVRLYLEGSIEDTISERVVSISLVNDMDDAWCDRDNDNYIEQLLGGATFPLLREVKGNFNLSWDADSGEIKITADLLSRAPRLKTIYFLVQGDSVDSWTVSFADCDDVQHPLSHVVVESSEDVIFYLFDTSNNQSLKERLKAISVNASETLNNEQQRDFLSKASFVHLFRTDTDISSIRHFVHLEALHVEREPYFVLKKMRNISDVDLNAEVLEINEFIEELENRFVIPKVPTGSSADGTVVQSLSEVQFYVDNNELFSSTTIFLGSLRDHVQEQSFPDSFVAWLQAKGMVRVGHYCLWVNDAGTVRMKTYATWGPRYLDHVKTYGGTLNLERILFGLPQGVDNILPLSMKSIRYNDPAIPVPGLLMISNLMELRVEIPVDVEEICALQNLEVLYLNDLGLTSLPDALGDLTNLKELHLWGNDLTTLPDSIRNLENLRVINISGNAFTSIPDSLLSLPHLQRVILRGGTEDWEQALDGNSSASKRVAAGEMILHDADCSLIS